MKFVLPLILFTAIALTTTACDTLANRRSLYSPKKGDGYWTRSLEDGDWKDRKGREVTNRKEPEVTTKPATTPAS